MSVFAEAVVAACRKVDGPSLVTHKTSRLKILLKD